MNALKLACLLASLQAVGVPAAAVAACSEDRETAAASVDAPSVADPIAHDASIHDPVIAGEAFACGPSLACDSTSQICMVVIGGPVGAPPGYSCFDVPEAAPSPTCSSIRDVGIGCDCDDSGAGVTVTCTAP